jgi:hypothetical protein
MLNCFFVLSYYLTENTRMIKDCFFGAIAYFAENSVPLTLYGNHGNLDLTSTVTMENKM